MSDTDTNEGVSEVDASADVDAASVADELFVVEPRP